jgi:tetratricopeptide (TPR) repeat protein
MPAPPSFFGSRRAIWLAGAVIAVAGLAAYGNSLSGSFVFLDVSAILENPTIRHLWPLGPVLSPPSDGGLTVGGRPLVNLSLALNYALSGTNVWSYHATNLLIHILAGLTLFGVVRRTLGWSALTPMRLSGGGTTQRIGVNALHPLISAFVIALLWTLHPLQTESVTYVVQRAESLMGLFYLLTLYCFIRGASASSFGHASAAKEAGNNVWLVLSVVACLLGMATKEVMASAPVIVLLYDRTFLGGSFREAWRRRGRWHLALAATWVLLGWLVLGTGGNRGGTSGFGLGVSWWTYASTQFPAIVHYLRLAVWPRPLVFYYPVQWSQPLGWELACILFVAALVVGSVWAFFGGEDAGLEGESGRIGGRTFGFLGLWFFAILAPTSLVPGMSQTMAEHRMYLALAPAIMAAVLAAQRGFGSRSLCLFLALAAGFGVITARRNLNYRNDLVLWSDTVAKSPGNPYVQSNLGLALASAGRLPEAIDHFSQAVQLNPSYAEAQNNLGLALAGTGRLPEAVGHYQKALQLKPAYPEAHSNLGVALADLGRYDEAIRHFAAALQLKPGYADARNDLAVTLASVGRTAEAIDQYREVLKADPGRADTHYNLGNALVQISRTTEAISEYEVALRLNPNNPEAHANLGALLANANRLPEAVTQYQQALALTPNDPDVHYNLGLALRTMGQEQAAAAQFSEAARLRRP